jgi:hypothetical protein
MGDTRYPRRSVRPRHVQNTVEATNGRILGLGLRAKPVVALLDGTLQSLGRPLTENLTVRVLTTSFLATRKSVQAALTARVHLTVQPYDKRHKADHARLEVHFTVRARSYAPASLT